MWVCLMLLWVIWPFSSASRALCPALSFIMSVFLHILLLECLTSYHKLFDIVGSEFISLSVRFLYQKVFDIQFALCTYTAFPLSTRCFLLLDPSRSRSIHLSPFITAFISLSSLPFSWVCLAFSNSAMRRPLAPLHDTLHSTLSTSGCCSQPVNPLSLIPCISLHPSLLSSQPSSWVCLVSSKSSTRRPLMLSTR